MIHLKQRRAGSSGQGREMGGWGWRSNVVNTRLNLPGRRAMAVGDVGRMIFKRKQTSGDTIWEIEFGFVCFVCAK